jgi:hypothetical protein
LRRRASVEEEGIVASVDIPLSSGPLGGLRVVDGCLVTDPGAEQLNDTPTCSPLGASGGGERALDPRRRDTAVLTSVD